MAEREASCYLAAASERLLSTGKAVGFAICELCNHQGFLLGRAPRNPGEQATIECDLVGICDADIMPLFPDISFNNPHA